MSNYDLSLRISDVEMEQLDRVNMVVDQAVTTGNPSVAIRYGQQLRLARHLSGVALAKLLWMMRERWEHFSSDDDFQTIAEAEMGVPQSTYKKYTEMWEAVIEHPYVQEDKKLLGIMLGKPIEGLIRLTAAARDGDFEPEHWEALARAPNKQGLIDIVREVRGLQTSASKTWRWLLGKGGKVMGRQGDGNYEEVAFVKRDGTDAQLAFEHLLEKMGVYVEPVK